MNNPKFSLILSIDHNHTDYRRLIKQAQSQDYSNLEIFIVSNRLNTKDQHIVDFLAVNDKENRSKHLSFLKRESISSLYNEGISHATGNYAWCIDENTILDDKSAVTKISEKIIQSKAQVIYLCSKATSKKNNKSELTTQTSDAPLDHPVSLVSQEDWHNHSRLVINLESLRLFDIHFSEGWSHPHGVLLSLQIIRFLPNIYHYSQDLVKFKKCLRVNSREFVAHFLSLNYILRYSKLIFGVHSSTFKSILKREVIDSKSIFKSVNESSLNRKIKDYLKFSRITCLNNFIHNLPKNDPETANMLASIEKLDADIQSKPSEMLNEFFKSSRIKVHCGAHKTATTYIQNILFNSRHDMALENTIYIHYEQLREDLSKAKHQKGITDTVERFAFAICNQAATLSFKLPSTLILSEENLIRPSSKINEMWDSKATYQNACNYSCACIRNGYNLDHLDNVAQIFGGSIEIIYTVRNYFDYLLSRHSEFLKWRSFKGFDEDFMDASDLKRCNWEYLISDMNKISSLTSIIAFEGYKKDPLKFANYLAEFNLANYEDKIENDQSVNRSRSSQALLDNLTSKKHLGIDANKLKKIFKEQIEKERGSEQKFTSKLLGKTLLEEKNRAYESIYLSTDSKSLIDKMYPLLADQPSSEYRLSDRLPLPERADLCLSRESKELKSYLNAIEKRSLFLDSKFKSRSLEYGISAMIRVKNEGLNIYNVLNSIKNCFDEIVVIDNNSSDNTIPEIDRAAKDFPLLKTKLKVHHYKFEIAKCGIDNFREPQNSPNSLASFYNYSLKKCNFSKVCKWDGDMFLPRSMEKSFQNFIQKVLTTDASSEDSTVFGVMKGVTVYKGSNSKFYCRPSASEREARIFDNSSGVYFVKEILWEQLFSLHHIERVISKDLTFVEFKDTSTNEFSHWSVAASLGMSPRKSKELRDFNLIKKITQYKDSEEIDRALLAHGFQETHFDVFDFSDSHKL